MLFLTISLKIEPTGSGKWNEAGGKKKIKLFFSNGKQQYSGSQTKGRNNGVVHTFLNRQKLLPSPLRLRRRRSSPGMAVTSEHCSHNGRRSAGNR